MKHTIHLLSLGCPKNRVDTEMLADMALSVGWSMTEDPLQAEVIVVNTCGFIDDAKAESLQAILELADAKTEGRCVKLVVAGCLAERYREDLERDLPEVDHVIGLGRLESLRAILTGTDVTRTVPRVDFPTARYGRLGSAPRHMAYVKIGDGCSRRCSFCAIPMIRGKAVSRRPRPILSEVRQLASAGVKEIVLVSQDTSGWGRDLTPRKNIGQLLESLDGIRALRWIRLLYLYPDRSVADLIGLLAGGSKLLPYVDLPMQHVTDRMLGIMRRGHGKKHLTDLIGKLRRDVPSLTLRTTFVVGHPGERERDFQALLGFLEEHRPERIGLLRYSAEQGTASATMADTVSPRTSYNRFRKAQSVARRIQRSHNRALVGTTVEVMIDGPSQEAPYLFDARMASQAPEVDGKVVVKNLRTTPAPGQMLEVEICKVMGADLLAEVVD